MSRTGFFVIAFYPNGCQVIEVDVGSWESKPTIHVGNPGYIEPTKEDEDG